MSLIFGTNNHLKNLQGAVNESGNVNLDTGAILLGRQLLDVLYGIICVNDEYNVSPQLDLRWNCRGS